MAPQFHVSVPSTDVFKSDIFKGKVLFCTGGATGICFKIVESVMKHGASAFIFGRREEKLRDAATSLTATTGGQCFWFAGDVRKPELLKQGVQECVEKFGKIDMVVNGAAGNFLSSIDHASENAFSTVIAIDLLGTYNTIKATIPHLKESHGSMISISATLHYNALPFQAHASAAKAGVDALTNVVAAEFGPFGIRANIIAPGPIAETEGASRLNVSGSEEVARNTPIQRLGETDDIANAAVFLFSPAASYITGSTLVADGGQYHLKSGFLANSYPDVLLNNVDIRNVADRSKL